MKKSDKPGYVDRLLLLNALDDARLPITKSERRIINALPTTDDDPYTAKDMLVNLSNIIKEIRKTN